MTNISIYEAFSRFWKHVIDRTDEMINQANEYTDSKFNTVNEYLNVNEATVTLSTSGWATHSALGYYQTATVSGITQGASAVDTDVSLSTTDADSNAELLAAWALIAAAPATVGSGTVTFYASETPEVNVPVNVRWL